MHTNARPYAIRGVAVQSANSSRRLIAQRRRSKFTQESPTRKTSDWSMLRFRGQSSELAWPFETWEPRALVRHWQLDGEREEKIHQGVTLVASPTYRGNLTSVRQ